MKLLQKKKYNKKEKNKKLLKLLLELLVLLVAVSAVDRLAFSWLERNFAFLPAVRAYCLVHFSWPKAASSKTASAASTA